MARPPPPLPAEVWTHVLGFLSAADKFSVRASCRFFKTLVDRGSLWKDWTAVLAFPNGSYNSRFWSTLRRRKVASVVVRSGRAKDWKLLARSLPAAATVVMHRTSQETLDSLRDFPHLERLAIRNSSAAVSLGASTVSRPRQLTHLSVCDVLFPAASVDHLVSAVSQFTNLTCLVCHRVGISGETVVMIHSLLTCLPQLARLSLSALHRQNIHHATPTPDPGALLQAHGHTGTQALSSLELVDCMDHSLPEDAMRLLPGLKSLAIFYKHSHEEMLESCPSPARHLKTWLGDLPQLSSLVVVNGPPVGEYATSIPATVTSLSLCVGGLSSEEMAAVAAQVPDLLHLHIDPWPSHLGAHTAQIPQLFPKLRSLKLRHEHVPEKDFLHLHQLLDLRYLEVIDTQPKLSALTGKLQILTNHRLQITASPPRRDVLSCPCVYQVY